MGKIRDYNVINGVVRWFDEAKGYGFIRSDNKEYFVHFKEIKSDGFKTLKEGDAVRFKPESGAKGPMATQVYLGYE